jgi:CBS domain-containing protein
MSLRQTLERELVSCGPETTVTDAAKLMEGTNMGAVVITREGKPIGILTDRDIVLRCVAEDLDCQSTLVSDVMSSPVSCLTLDAGIFNVVQCMRRNGIRRVPIVDEQGTVVGLVSMGDVLQLLAEEIYAMSEPTAPEAPKIIDAA